MLKRFSNYSEALEFGTKFSDETGCSVSVATVYIGKASCVAFVAGPSSAHLLRKPSSFRGNGSGWYFAGTGVMADSDDGRAMLALEDRPALPGGAEKCYHLFACCTTGFTHEERVEMALEMDKNKTCVWHECTELARRKNPGKEIKCECGRCKKR